MTLLVKNRIVGKANSWINDQDFDEELIALEEGIEEHDFCFSLLWCRENEVHLSWKEKALSIGTGRLLISKDGEIAGFEGSSPGVDWVHRFELKVQNLEEYWYMAIPYEKENISKLKSAIKCTTAELLKMLDENKSIVYFESKSWTDQFPSFQRIADDLNQSRVTCQVEIRVRNKA